MIQKMREVIKKSRWEVIKLETLEAKNKVGPFIFKVIIPNLIPG